MKKKSNSQILPIGIILLVLIGIIASAYLYVSNVFKPEPKLTTLAQNIFAD